MQQSQGALFVLALAILMAVLFGVALIALVNRFPEVFNGVF